MDKCKADKSAGIKNRPNFVRKSGVTDYSTKGPYTFSPKYSKQKVTLVELEGEIVLLFLSLILIIVQF